MTIFADESVDGPVVHRLRRNGWDVAYVAEAASGTADEEVLRTAVARGSVLLTADKDFGELVFRLRRVHWGVVLYRLAGLSLDEKASIVVDVFRNWASELTAAFCVITPTGVRIRRSNQAE